MKNREHHIWCLKSAEAQFRLATAVRLATTFQRQPLDLPIVWVHGRTSVPYSSISLSAEEADFGAWGLQRSATFLMASALLETMQDAADDPKSDPDPSIVACYQIARIIRNAFAHAPQSPTWSIDPDCRDRTFEIPGVITLATAGIHGKAFDWRDYGGPLAILALLRHVQQNVLKEPLPDFKVVPLPQRIFIQQGDLILERLRDHDLPLS